MYSHDHLTPSFLSPRPQKNVLVSLSNGKNTMFVYVLT
nr:MAG TPA: hypothetical protein [Caudoviricetes sp.]